MPKVRALYQTEPAALDLEVPVTAVDSSLIEGRMGSGYSAGGRARRS